jgi:hypothetical protein
MYGTGGAFYAKVRDPLNVADIEGASSKSQTCPRIRDPRPALDAALTVRSACRALARLALARVHTRAGSSDADAGRVRTNRTRRAQGTRPPRGRYLTEGRQLDPLQPKYQLQSFEAVAREPRSITEQMTTRQHQWTLVRPDPRIRTVTSAHTLDYSDVNVTTHQQRFRASSATRDQPMRVADIAHAKQGFRSVPARNTDPCQPVYTDLEGDPLRPDATRFVPGGRRYVRAAGEADPCLRTHDIDLCFADAFAQKYGAFATRPTNETHDILGAQHDTICREPQVWRVTGPYIEPGVRHYPEVLPNKRTNRVDDIYGTTPVKSTMAQPVYAYYMGRATELQASRDAPRPRAQSAPPKKGWGPQ